MNKFQKRCYKFMKRWHLDTLLCKDGTSEFHFHLQNSRLSILEYVDGEEFDAHNVKVH